MQIIEFKNDDDAKIYNDYANELTKNCRNRIADELGVPDNELENIVDVAVENGTIVAVNKNGEVLASGYNGYGNLGNNTTQDSTKFEKVIEKIDTTTTDTGTTETPTYLTGVKSVTAG